LSKLYVDEIYPKTGDGHVTLHKPILFNARMSDTQSVPTSTAIPTFSSPSIDTVNGWDSSNRRYTISKDGYYRFYGSLNVYGVNVESRYLALRLFKNDTENATAHGQVAAASGSSDYGFTSLTWIEKAVSGDIYDIRIDTAVSGLSITRNLSYFQLEYIGDD